MTSGAYSYLEATREMASAVKEQNAEDIRFFYHEGADPNFTNSLGITLLQNAANDGKLLSAATLLEVGANPNITGGPSGWSALHYAAYRDNKAMTDLLLNAKADPNVRARIDNATPLHTAAFSGELDVVKALVKAGADVMAEDSRGHTAMQVAIFRSEEKNQFRSRPFIEIAEYLKAEMETVCRNSAAVIAQQEQVASDLARLKARRPEGFRLKPR